MHYLLMYELAPDYLERRGALRDAHLKLARAHAERGELLLGGALADPVDTALLLFEGDSPHGCRSVRQCRSLRAGRPGFTMARARVEHGRQRACVESGSLNEGLPRAHVRTLPRSCRIKRAAHAARVARKAYRRHSNAIDCSA